MTDSGNDTYKTIAAPTTGNFRDRGSKFLAYAYPVATVQEVKNYVQALKQEHPKAVHHCFAYRIGADKMEFRANDDGEPSGSAGRPILGQIDSLGLTNTLVVVVRYFGGTLLGIPGLINAYKTVTAAALAEAQIIEKQVELLVTLEFDYPVMGEVLHLLKQSGATVYEQELQLFCRIRAGVPLAAADACLARLSEIRSVKATRG
jgi:uncharacterized YigZ family protein